MGRKKRHSLDEDTKKLGTITRYGYKKKKKNNKKTTKKQTKNIRKLLGKQKTLWKIIIREKGTLLGKKSGGKR